MKNPNYEQLKRFDNEFDETSEPLTSNHNFRVPFLLNDHLYTLSTNYEDVVENEKNESELYEVFRSLENLKGHRFEYSFD
ncbi:MAG: hypothetical protein AAFY30_14335, partial [Cyanobacteria bacterium J06642_12]